MSERVQELEKKLDCLYREVKAFERRWIDTLSAAKESKRVSKEIRHAILEKTLIGMAWSALLLLGYALWDYIRGHLK